MEIAADRAPTTGNDGAERFADGSLIVRVERLGWTPWASPGASFKLLSTNRGTGTWSALLKLEPGIRLPDQYRLVDAYVSVVSGSGSCDGVPLSRGSFHVQHGGRSYLIGADGNGLVCYILALGGSLIDKGASAQTLVDLDWLYDQAVRHGAAAHLPARPGGRR